MLLAQSSTSARDPGIPGEQRSRGTQASLCSAGRTPGLGQVEEPRLEQESSPADFGFCSGKASSKAASSDADRALDVGLPSSPRRERAREHYRCGIRRFLALLAFGSRLAA